MKKKREIPVKLKKEDGEPKEVVVERNINEVTGVYDEDEKERSGLSNLCFAQRIIWCSWTIR